MPQSKEKHRERMKEVMRLKRSGLRLDGYCADCGFDEIPAILMFHHIDGDRVNNKPENIARLCPTCHSKRHLNNGCVSYKSTPTKPVLQPKLNIPGLKIEGNKIIGVELQPKVEVLQPIPRYNPKVHKEGDKVLRFFNNKWVEVTVPEIDLDR